MVHMWQFTATYVYGVICYTVNYNCGFWLAQASIFFANFVCFIGRQVGLAYTQVIYSYLNTYYVHAHLLMA